MEAAWSPSVVPAKLDAAFCRGLGKALLQAAAAQTTSAAGGSGGTSLTALPAAECLKLLRAAEKLLRAEPALVHVSLWDARLNCMCRGVLTCRPMGSIARCHPACLPTACLPAACLPTACHPSVNLRLTFDWPAGRSAGGRSCGGGRPARSVPRPAGHVSEQAEQEGGRRGCVASGRCLLPACAMLLQS